MKTLTLFFYAATTFLLGVLALSSIPIALASAFGSAEAQLLEAMRTDAQSEAQITAAHREGIDEVEGALVRAVEKHPTAKVFLLPHGRQTTPYPI